MTRVVKAHDVDVRRIVSLAPIVTASQHIVSPEVGMLLVLEDGARVKWLSEPDSPAAREGDYFVTDSVMHTTYLVSSAKVGDLFE